MRMWLLASTVEIVNLPLLRIIFDADTLHLVCKILQLSVEVEVGHVCFGAETRSE